MAATESEIVAEYEYHRRYFIATARRYLKNIEDAEDMVNHAFMQALTAADQYRGSATVRTWITTIVRNACLDLIRRKRSRPEGHSESLDEVDYIFHSREPTAEQEAAHRQIMIQVRSAIKSLPDKQRRALNDFLRTGEITGNNSTFKVQKFRAVQSLRWHFRDHPSCVSEIASQAISGA